MAESIRPQGRIVLIDDPVDLVDITVFKFKSVAISWEFMYTRSMYETDDMQVQHDILSNVSRLVDKGKVRSTMTRSLGPMSAESLRQAHAELESGRMIGKLVLQGIA